MLFLERAKQVRDVFIKEAHIIPLANLLETLEQLGYTNAEVKFGIELYMQWKGLNEA